jgi:hypothetical protein
MAPQTQHMLTERDQISIEGTEFCASKCFHKRFTGRARISLLSPLPTLFIAPLECSLLDKDAYPFPQYSLECDGDIVDQNRNLSANCTCREVWVVLIMLPAAEL